MINNVPAVAAIPIQAAAPYQDPKLRVSTTGDLGPESCVHVNGLFSNWTIVDRRYRRQPRRSPDHSTGLDISPIHSGPLTDRVAWRLELQRW
ncbi:hypothetical protein EV647_0579 [Kribbella sp. VKM Ac-2566]|nr:hypothetical protein EV647_0579 [Kribbella sp. VKM Ac-2566]